MLLAVLKTMNAMANKERRASLSTVATKHTKSMENMEKCSVRHCSFFRILCNVSIWQQRDANTRGFVDNLLQLICCMALCTAARDSD